MFAAPAFAAAPAGFASSAARLAAVRRLEMVVGAHERKAGPDQPNGGVPGFAVAVLQGDDLLLRGGVGLASIEQGVAIGPRTSFRIASISKQFTCAAVLLLAREGALDIDADIRDVLPGRLPGLGAIKAGALSLRNLMHMSSGLRDYLTMFRAGGVELDHVVSEAAIDALIDRHAALNFEPATRFLYSNTNYRLLGQAVEKVSGLALGEFLKRRIFEPLGMAGTRHTPDPFAVEAGLASAYLQQADGAGRFDARGLQWRRAAQGFALGGEGGLVSCLDDLLLWSRALLAPPRGFEFLPALLATTQTFTHGHGNVYARGQEALAYRGLATIGHGGLWPDYRSEMLLAPARGIAVLVLANDSGVNPHALARRLLDALLWDELGAPDAGTGKPPPPGLYFDDEHGLLVEIGGPHPLHGNAPTLTLFSAVMPLRAEADGWWAAEAGAIVAKVKARKDGIEFVDDAGRTQALKKLQRAAALPSGIEGGWRCAELDCRWTIVKPGGNADADVGVSGPLLRAVGFWRARPIAGDWIEIVAPGRFLPASWTARLTRSAAAGDALEAHTARARHLRFVRE